METAKPPETSATRPTESSHRNQIDTKIYSTLQFVHLIEYHIGYSKQCLCAEPLKAERCLCVPHGLTVVLYLQVLYRSHSKQGLFP
jgi:hypothetical protein